MIRRIAWIAGLGGAALFAALAAALASDETRIRIPAITALVTFAAVSLAYLGGIEAGLALREQAGRERARAWAMGSSLAAPLAAWGLLWLPTVQWQVGAAIGLFIAVWALDLGLARLGLLAPWFLRLRSVATALVCAALAFALFRS
jgi:uncharacterized membrane protein